MATTMVSPSMVHVWHILPQVAGNLISKTWGQRHIIWVVASTSEVDEGLFNSTHAIIIQVIIAGNGRCTSRSAGEVQLVTLTENATVLKTTISQEQFILVELARRTFIEIKSFCCVLFETWFLCFLGQKLDSGGLIVRDQFVLQFSVVISKKAVHYWTISIVDEHARDEAKKPLLFVAVFFLLLFDEALVQWKSEQLLCHPSFLLILLTQLSH